MLEVAGLFAAGCAGHPVVPVDVAVAAVGVDAYEHQNDTLLQGCEGRGVFGRSKLVGHLHGGFGGAGFVAVNVVAVGVDDGVPLQQALHQRPRPSVAFYELELGGTDGLDVIDVRLTTDRELNERSALVRTAVALELNARAIFGQVFEVTDRIGVLRKAIPEPVAEKLAWAAQVRCTEVFGKGKSLVGIGLGGKGDREGKQQKTKEIAQI